MHPAPTTSLPSTDAIGQSADSAEDRLCPRPARQGLASNWIWLPEKLGHGWRNSYAHFRRTFDAAGSVSVHIAADTAYELHLDGNLVDRGTAPAATDYKIFDTHEFNVAPGQHVLAVLVHHFGQPCATAMRSRPGQIGRAHV